MKGVCQFLFSQMILQLSISLRMRKSRASPLSKYVATLREIAQQRNASLSESSVLVGEHSSVFGSKGRESDETDDTRDNEGIAAFSLSWLPGKDSKAEPPKDVKKKKRKRKTECQDQVAMDEDIVQVLVLSSDEEDRSLSDTSSADKYGVKKPQLLRSWKARSRNALHCFVVRTWKLCMKFLFDQCEEINLNFFPSYKSII
ncbi:nucleolar complex-associated protein 2-like isoform X2 [Malus domestica]|uniref:nucleolar complex-associated protein 2-like isoform X2 n=1 Tax=Malus domestica TaxID=3750 RepID=UPI0004990B5A